ncbi:MAG: sugar ABC transporter substrate-binding protein [Ilumatobacter sp.]|uniref:ABC transporter substrate-binding protein n=1 Tax=Ilumatobacter sp. TaxID=1967498 RepID=UPI002628B7C5|nr:sugar ABC transporter substrate-binding protein [Ilumatobacter sp.]MDJ0769611.1 sugar ABC transporter substrate-binding protein [Ilumatobacter sp.]
MKQRTGRGRSTWLTTAGVLVAFGLVAAACGDDDDDDGAADDTETDDGATDDGATDDGATDDGATDDGATDDGADADRSINVAIVGNPIIDDIASLVPEHFTADTGIEVNFTVLPEQELREITTRDVGAGGDQFDVVQIGMYETPQFGANGWLVGLNDLAASTPDYQIDDLIPAVRGGLSVDGELYASPFYAESSFLMYRKDVMDENGIEMPAAPTWQEVADIARQIDSDEMAGICLRGKPGWGDLGAAFTTVLNTFGGTWWLANDDGSIGAAQVDQPEYAEALNFYVDLVNDAGEDDAANSSFTECLSLYQEGKVAMWYDATVAASILEAEDSPVKGLNDFALAPVKETDASGWLWAWTFAIPVSTTDQEAAWEFISWATSPAYIELAANELPGGWAAVPPGTRQSTYDNPNYQEAAGLFAQRTIDAMLAAPIDNPGTTPRPGLPGVQYVGVPEFQDVGTRCTELFSAAIAGSMSVDDALGDCQAIASEVST